MISGKVGLTRSGLDAEEAAARERQHFLELTIPSDAVRVRLLPNEKKKDYVKTRITSVSRGHEVKTELARLWDYSRGFDVCVRRIPDREVLWS